MRHRESKRLARNLRATTALLSALSLFVTQEAAYALPVGGQVAAGSAAIATSGSTTTIDQSSTRAIVNWQGFDVGSGETVNFNQPAGGVTLNRVNSGSASQILGNINATGTVMLVNPQGVFFGGGAQVNVGNLLATTADIDNARFMNGDYRFDQPGDPNASIVNAGHISVADGGLVTLAGPNVANTGIIDARLGKVQLGSGDTFTLDLYGDGLINLQASPAITQQIVDNSGVIAADGGKVEMTAAAGAQEINSLINMDGLIEANSVGSKNGQVVLYAAGSNAVAGNDASQKGQKPGASGVLVSGTISASGYASGQTGGSVSVLGDNVGLLSGGLIDASGDAGGGYIRIGGDFHGAGSTPTALNTYVDANSLILANANTTGNGGNVAVWADGNTWFGGNILAEGGKNSGNGGFVETSGHGYLDANGYVDLLAPKGSKGTYLLDPTDITIYGNVTPAFTSTDGTINLASSLQLWLDASDTSKVQLTYNSLGTTATGTSGQNTITVGSATGLVVGERIQLGGTSDTFAASVNDNASGSGIYTITNISGTTITLDANLASSVSGVTLYGGYVSQLTDKSGLGNNATQATAANMPLWIANGQNGLGIAQFNGSSDYMASSLALSNVSAASLFGTMQYLNAGSLEVAEGWGTPSTWGGLLFVNRNLSGYKFDSTFGNGSSEVYTGSIASNTNWHIQGGIFGEPSGQALLNGSNGNTVSYSNTLNASSPFVLGAYTTAVQYPIRMNFGDTVYYTTNLSTNAAAIVNQYESAKWGIVLAGPGVIGSETGLTGAEAQSAMASTQAGATTDGYSVFTTRYLERLSQSSNLILDASHNITLDFKGDTLSLASGKSLTLTAGNQITTGSAGTITTSNGNINLNATGGISIGNAFTFNSGGGAINFNNAVTLGADTTVNSGGGAVSFGSTVDGAHNLTVNGGNGGSASFTGEVGSATGLGALSVTAGNGVAFNKITASSISMDASGGSGNLANNGAGLLTTGGGNVTLTAAAGEIDLSANPIVTGGGAVNLTTTSGNILVDPINTGSGNLTVTSTTGDLTLYGGIPSTSGLQAYYAFNEGSGTSVIDSSGNGNTGTINGATYSSSTPTGTGYSLSFNGTNTIAIPTIALGTTGTTIAWVKPNTQTGSFNFGGILGDGASNTAPLYVGGATDTSFGYTTGSGDVGYVGPSMTGTWHQIASVRQGTTVTLYLDGALVATGTLTANDAASIAYIGTRNAGFDYKGNLDDVRLYNTALSMHDIGNLYNPSVSWQTGTTNFSGHNITLNLAGDTLNVSAGKSLTLTAGNQITTASAGTISASQSGGAGGNITLKANGLNFAAIPAILTNGVVTFEPDTASTTIGVAGGAGSLSVTSGILNAISGASEVDIGATGDSSLLTADAYTWGENARLLSGSGRITIAGAQSMGGNSFFAQTAGAADITLEVSGSVTSNAVGTAITLASGQDFINNNGSGALTASGGRWLVYSTNPANDTIGGLSTSFRRFSCTYGGSCPSFPATGNGLLYSYTPTLTATPDALSITYGDAAPNLTGYAYTLSGYLGSDLGSDSVTGALNGSTNYAQGNSVGSYNINYSNGLLSSALGYGFAYASSPGGLMVNPATTSAAPVVIPPTVQAVTNQNTPALAPTPDAPEDDDTDSVNLLSALSPPASCSDDSPAAGQKESRRCRAAASE